MKIKQINFFKLIFIFLISILGKSLFSNVRFINLSTKEPLLVKSVPSAYQDIKKEDQAGFHTKYIFDGRRSQVKCSKNSESLQRSGARNQRIKNNKVKIYTLETKRTNGNYDMGHLLISPASSDRTKEVIFATKGIIEGVGGIAKKLVDTVKGFVQFEPSSIDTAVCNITKIATDDIPGIKKNVEIINSISVKTTYASDDIFLVIDRVEKSTDPKDDKKEKELEAPGKIIKLKDKIFVLDSMNKHIAVYVHRKIGAKLPRNNNCEPSKEFYTLDKEGSDFSFEQNKTNAVKNNFARKSRKFGFNANQIFWCEGKKHKGFYPVKLFKSLKTNVVKVGKGLIKDNYRFFITIDLIEGTHNKENTHRNRKKLYLSVPCKPVSKSKSIEKICAEYHPKNTKGEQKIQKFVRKLEDAIKYKRNIEEIFNDQKIKRSKSIDGSYKKRNTNIRTFKGLGEKPQETP